MSFLSTINSDKTSSSLDLNNAALFSHLNKNVTYNKIVMLPKAAEDHSGFHKVNTNSKERFLSLVMKRIKSTPKVSSEGLRSSFANKGWNTLSSGFQHATEKKLNCDGLSYSKKKKIREVKNTILSSRPIIDSEISEPSNSPLKYESSKTPTNRPKRKSIEGAPMLFDIHQFNSAFKTHETPIRKRRPASDFLTMSSPSLTKSELPTIERYSSQQVKLNTVPQKKMQEFCDLSKSFVVHHHNSFAKDGSPHLANSCPNISPISSGNRRNSQSLHSESELISHCSVSPEDRQPLHTGKENERSKNLLLDLFEEKHFKRLKKNSDKRSHLSNLLNTTLEGKTSDAHKGSDWLNSIQVPSKSKNLNESLDFTDLSGKKKLRNVLPGGLAEKIQHLQLRERSSKVMWNHHKDLKEKNLRNCLDLSIDAMQVCGELAVSKCQSFFSVGEGCEQQTDLSGNISHGQETGVNQRSQFFVLFRRSMFNKLELHKKRRLRIYPPWRQLDIPHLPHPVIFCTYFVEPLQAKDEDRNCSMVEVDAANNSLMVDLECIQAHSLSLLGPPLLGMPTSSVSKVTSETCRILQTYDGTELNHSLTARIQRIWSHKSCGNRISKLAASASHESRYTFLLQSVEGTFYELLLPVISSTMTQFWNKVIRNGEGKCFTFHNISLTNRLDMNSCPTLCGIFGKIKEVQNKQIFNDKVSQRFCYQFSVGEICKVANHTSDEDVTPYYNFNIKLLSHVKMTECDNVRISCIGKVLCEANGQFYISDESLVYSPTKYMLLVFSHIPANSMEEILGSTVLIREAIFQKGVLRMDKYSNFIILLPSLDQDTNLLPNYCNSIPQSRLKRISVLKLKDVSLSLTQSSNVWDIVHVKGKISSVDEENAVSWLECNLCHKDSLLQVAASSNIYCEDCRKTVSHPILNVKLQVNIIVTFLPKVKVRVELHATTIKKILRMDNATFQPRRILSDVLDKEIGPLYCYIKAFGNNRQTFHLVEIQEI